MNAPAAPTVTPQQTTFEAPLEGATSADVTIGSLVSDVSIEPLDPSSPLLVVAEIGYIGQLTTTSEGAEHKTVVIQDELNSYSYNGPALAFDIALNRLPAVGLNVTASSGSVNLNLGAFNLNRLDISTASGAVEAQLPAGSGPYPVNVTTASGDVTFTLADSAAVQFESISTSSGNVRITSGEGGVIAGTQVGSSSGSITFVFRGEVNAGFRVSTSSGDITVEAPADVPVRLEIVSNASGEVTVRSDMTQIQGEGDLGIWESAGYNEEGAHVLIVVTSTASGDVFIR